MSTNWDHSDDGLPRGHLKESKWDAPGFPVSTPLERSTRAMEEIRRADRAAALCPDWGWHDDHCDKDGTAEYRLALMQVRAEFARFVDEIERVLGPARPAALQLGMGNCRASHAVWRFLFFRSVVTIDLGVIAVNGAEFPGKNTHDEAAYQLAAGTGTVTTCCSSTPATPTPTWRRTTRPMSRWCGPAASSPSMTRCRVSATRKLRFGASSRTPALPEPCPTSEKR